jgi:hypothetical protein
MVTKDYQDQDSVTAARSVIIELAHILGEYRTNIVVVGGWVPYLLLPEAVEPHIGSLDVDLALDHRHFAEDGYKTIKVLLESHGYGLRPDGQPFVFFKDVTVAGKVIKVEVDLLAGEYHGTAGKHRTQRVQDVMPRKALGCDLAFEQPVVVTLNGPLPDGSLDRVEIQVAGLSAFIVMKAMAMRDRLSPKDPYDIVFCLRHCHMPALISRFNAVAERGRVKEAERILADQFASTNHVGPRQVVDFLGIKDPEEQERVKRDAFERVQALLKKLLALH